MGSSGYSFQLEAVGPTATDGRLRKAVLDTLYNIWGGRRGAMLPYEWRRFAVDWICLGEDSLLTIEVDGGQITFWFYDSVGWSIGLAEHWLYLALAVRRGEFEAVFARLGYRINPANWPDLKNEYLGKGRFFHGDGGIGEPTSEGIYWQVKDGHYEVPSTPLDELSTEARQEVEQLLATKRCRCGVCKSIWNWKSDPEDVPGFSTQREAVFISRTLAAFELRPEGCIVASGGSYDSTWTARAASVAGPWEGILQLSVAQRHVDGVFTAPDALVAHTKTNSGVSYCSTSSDGGRTWSEPVLHTSFGKAKRLRFFQGATPGEVYAAAEPAKTLFRSKDGGRSFEVVADNLQIGGKPIAMVTSLVCHGERLFATARMKGNERLFVVSDDRGQSFQKIEVPKYAYPLQVVSWGDVLICVLQQSMKVIVMRSTDNGASFTEHVVGTGAFTCVAAGPRGLLVGQVKFPNPGGNDPGGGVFLSEDGTSFVLTSKHEPQRVFADPTGERLGFFFGNLSLFSLRHA